MKYIILFFLLSFTIQNCNIASVKEGEKKIEAQFIKTVKGSKHSKVATILVHSNALNLHVESSVGNIAEPQQTKVVLNQPFHIASVGKIFTAVLIFQLIEAGKLTLNDSVKTILGPDLLKDLYMFEGIDSSEKVTISQLLAHTSGVADYFESVDGKEKALLEEITKNPEKFWKPKELLDFSRKNQKTYAHPGDKYHYSDTGYVLLGLVIEKISKKTFEKIIQEKIFSPLGMKNSYMYLRSEPINKNKLPISTMMLGPTNVTSFKSVSSDWAGGGIISTTEDLFLFSEALIKGKLIKEQTYLSMRGKEKFLDGINYGTGLMTVRFNDMSVFMPKTPELHGHMGLLSTLLFYAPEYDAHIIVNLGSTDDISDTVQMMFWIMQTLKEVKNLEKK